MEPMSIIAAAKAASAARRAWGEADAEVAAIAKQRGVTKDVIWAEIQAETLRQAGETAGRLTDPLGWRAAAAAFETAERDRAFGERDHSLTDRLREVAGLHRDGILSDEEFASAKARLLDSL